MNHPLEREVLGQLINSPEYLPGILEVIGKRQVFGGPFQKIFETVVAIVAEGEKLDLLTLQHHLSPKYFEVAAECSTTTTSTHGAEQYAKLLVAEAIRKELRYYTRTLTGRLDADEPLQEIMDAAQRELFAIAEQSHSRKYLSVEQAIQSAFDLIGSKGIPSGVKELDLITGGWRDSDLILIAGRPSQGKTALGLAAAKYAAKQGMPGGFFSAEMSVPQLILRLVAGETGLSYTQILSGNLTEGEVANVQAAGERLRKLPLYLDDSAGISIEELVTKARNMRAEKKIAYVVIDYLQLLSARAKKESREKEVAYISGKLKGLAKSLCIPVIAISQLSRQGEYRKDRRPVLSDLRDSGAMEQDADLVVFVHNPNPPEEVRPTVQEMELIVAKHRSGPTGIAKVAFMPKTMEYKDLTWEYQVEARRP